MLGLNRKTVAKWLARSRFDPQRQPRSSILDPFKGRITRCSIRIPTALSRSSSACRKRDIAAASAFCVITSAASGPPNCPSISTALRSGRCAQIDWGTFGTVAVGNTRRRLSFFVIVLAYSRQMYVEFTVSQTMEHFLACHQHAFAAFAGVP